MTYSRFLSPDGISIYLFHGVVIRSQYAVRNYTKKHIEVDAFRRCLLDLRDHGTPISMDDLLAHHEAGVPLPPRAFAITFDDGFENNCSVAAPVLSELNIPATFYVTTNFVDRNGMSWIDRIEYCLEQVPAGRVSLPWDDSCHSFSDTATRIEFLTYLRNVVKADPKIDVDAFADEVFRQCHMDPVYASDGPLDRKMSWEQVRALHDDRLFTVGGHSHTHKNLAFLPENEMKREIATSLKLLREKAGIVAIHYSYPEGLEHCFSPSVISELQRGGIRCSPTAISGVNLNVASLFHLRRVMVS